MRERHDDDPGVYVGPGDLPVLAKAVADGGGRVVPLDEAEAIVYRSDADSPQEVEQLVHDRIRWVQLPHAGVDRFVDAGIITTDPVWTSARGAFSRQVAEHACALMLAAARDVPFLARQRTWTGKHTRSFAGSTVVLLGAGGIGRELVRLMEPYRVRVLAVSDSGDFPGAERTVPRADYRELLPEADYVVVLAPSTPQTRGMVARAELATMKDSAWLVNVARGDLVDTDDLVACLAEEGIGGAALDVTDPEPLPDDHPLWNEPRALVTPHVANPDDAYWPTLAQRVRDNVRRWVAGEELLGVIDPDAGF